jgi:hypothetical protein
MRATKITGIRAYEGLQVLGPAPGVWGAGPQAEGRTRATKIPAEHMKALRSLDLLRGSAPLPSFKDKTIQRQRR